MFSWLLQEVLGNLPSWLWPAVAGAGATVYFLSHLLANFPNFKPYAFFIKPVSFIVILIGVFMFGGAGVTDILQAQIKEQEAKIAVAEQASSDANKAVQTKIITHTKVIHDTQVVYQEKIKEVEKKIDADCKLDPEAIVILNGASKNPLGAAK
jgi:hypothetical protein